MSDATDTPSPDSDAEEPRHSVLAELPRTRPQRASSRREAARARAQAGDDGSPAAADGSATVLDGSSTAADGAGGKARGTAAKQAKRGTGTKPAAKRSASKPTAQRGAPRAQRSKPETSQPAKERAKIHAADDGRGEPVPRQGFEPEDDLGRAPISPPSAAELVGSLAELAGELAQTGVSAGGKLLKSIFSRP